MIQEAIEPPSDNDFQTSLNQLEQRSRTDRGQALNVMDKQLIYMKKVKISYKHIPQELQFCLVQCYKKCLQKRCLDEMWVKNSQNKKGGQMQTIYIKDEDALNLISKMIQNLQKTKLELKISQKTNKLQALRNHIQKSTNIEKDTMGKLLTLRQLQALRNMPVHSKQAVKQFQAFLQHVKAEKLDKLKKLSLTQRQIEELKGEMSVYMIESVGNEYKELLYKAIRKMARNLFTQTILFIVEISKSPYVLASGQKDESQVYVIFEQSYHSFKMKKRYLIQIISAKVYLQKAAVYQNLYGDGTDDKTHDLMCCHKCMKIYPSKQLKFCQHDVSNSETKSYPSTDHNLYRELNIKGNFGFEGQEQFVLPYFIYNKVNNKYKCHRAICKECQKTNQISCKLKGFRCSFCDGSCICTKCLLAYSIVKMIAFDKQQPSAFRSYDKILNLLYHQPSPYKLEQLSLRRRNDNAEFNLYTTFQKTNPHKKVINSISPPCRVERQISTSHQQQQQQQQHGQQQQYKVNVVNQLLNRIEQFIDPFVKNAEKECYFQNEKMIEADGQELHVIQSNSDILNDNNYECNYHFPQNIPIEDINDNLFHDL